MAIVRLTKTRQVRADGGNNTSRAVSLPPDVCELFGWGVGTDLAFLVNHETKTLTLIRADKATGEAAA